MVQRIVLAEVRRLSLSTPPGGLRARWLGYRHDLHHLRAAVRARRKVAVRGAGGGLIPE
jgi:hypothetical protein